MREYKPYIDVGIDCGQMGVINFRVSQLQCNELTRENELKDLEDIKKEVLELFINKLLNSYNVCYNVKVDKSHKTFKNVVFKTEHYGETRRA